MRSIPEKLKVYFPHDSLRPSQEKAIDAGLFEGKNLLIATPTASGKTIIGLLGIAQAVNAGKKGIYLAPLKALASEKARAVKNLPLKSALSIGDYDDDDSSLGEADLIVTTPEKLDSLLRHHVPWIQTIGCIVVDEIHLLGENSRGPTLEILLTMLRQINPRAQIIGLSATVKNASEIAQWLDATLVVDNWRPVELREGTWTSEGIKYRNKKNK